MCYDPIVTYTESSPPVLVAPLVGVNILVVPSGLFRARTRRTTDDPKLQIMSTKQLQDRGLGFNQPPGDPYGRAPRPRDQMKNFDGSVLLNVRMKNTGVPYIIDHGPSIMDKPTKLVNIVLLVASILAYF